MIYFDNAATSYPKPKSVIRAFVHSVNEAGGNPGRSAHRLSVRASEEIYRARETVCDFIGAECPEHVVFTYNATHALNLAIRSFVTRRCHLIISDMEHNSVIRPLKKLERDLGVEYSAFSSYGDIEKSVSSLLRPDTVGIISTLQSNVTGKRIDARILSKIAKKKGLFLLLDGSQLIGHYPFNFGEIKPDVLCAPAHKGLSGVQGAGVAVFSRNERLESFIDGGSGSESRNPEMPMLLPEAYEAGTPGTPAICALRAGIEHVRSIGVDEIAQKIDSLTGRAAEIINSIKGVTVYPHSSGILCFNVDGIGSSYLSSLLDKTGICTRGGLHCAPSAHELLGTIEQGAVRCSFSYTNTRAQLEKFYKALKLIKQIS